MLTLLVFEIKKGKNKKIHKKLKKLTIIYHYLLEEESKGKVCGGVLLQKMFEI
jgi:hypothetical protein